ncbi:MAG: ferrous iron transport protein A, partial [Oscillospiraceae bacterium]|nr:ferrous iron transport protein A [Oscillospiraceae bacterium]
MPEPSVPMTLLNEGEKAVISSYHLPDSLKQRLMSMGMIPETRIE